MTSCIPNLALSNPTIPPNIAPAITPAIITIGICIIGGKSNLIPTIVAAIVPIIYWPSAPMLNKPVLNANATLRPVKIIGVALMIVFDIYLGFEKIPLKSALKASIELYPAN